MTADGSKEIEVSETETSGLLPAAWSVFISPDQIGLWRLRKSLALSDARWYFDAGRKSEVRQLVSVARSCSREVMRILHWQRTGTRSMPSLARPVKHALRPTIRQRVEKRDPADLTQRELAIATLVGKGLSNIEIGRRLDVSPAYVSMYVSNAKKKLGLTDRAAFSAHFAVHA